jgi:leader peptidase (prepilin peptidase)/N-methyltransferase
MYPVVEFTTGILFVWWFLIGFTVYFQLTQPPFDLAQKIFWLIVAVLFIIIFFTDLMSSLIPDYAVGLLFLLGLVYRVSLTLSGIMRWEDLLLSLIGMVVVTAFFFALWWGTKQKGMGFGDVKLVAGLALILGWPNVIVGTFLSFVFGSVVGVLLIMNRKKKFGQTIPFGPFLILSTLVSLLYGDALLQWYLQLL